MGISIIISSSIFNAINDHAPFTHAIQYNAMHLTNKNRHPTPLQITRHNLRIRLIKIMQQKPTQHSKDQTNPDRVSLLLGILREWFLLCVQVPNDRWPDIVEVMA
jgi:hypothetical protein